MEKDGVREGIRPLKMEEKANVSMESADVSLVGLHRPTLVIPPPPPHPLQSHDSHLPPHPYKVIFKACVTTVTMDTVEGNLLPTRRRGDYGPLKKNLWQKVPEKDSSPA
ncbi:hypothetical protein SK128_015709 [Halocaridina rubra]|uniref:Uncharacterized protein n=1 Tax=Halocaridina rubra TaxID=373956 RepID=A0AAN8WHB0_HALRR